MNDQLYEKCIIRFPIHKAIIKRNLHHTVIKVATAAVKSDQVLKHGQNAFIDHLEGEKKFNKTNGQQTAAVKDIINFGCVAHAQWAKIPSYVLQGE